MTESMGHLLRRRDMRLFLVLMVVSQVTVAQGFVSPEDEFPGAMLRRPKPNLPPKKPRPVPPPAPQTRPAPVPVPPASPKPPPPAPRPPPCTLGLEVVQTVTGSGLELEGFVVNQTSRRLTLSLLNACPNPSMQFTGLPEGVSAFETCAMGPCVQRAPVVVTLAPRERRRLAVGFVPWEGNACSAPLPVEDFSIRGEVYFAGAAVTTCTLPTQKRAKPVVVPPSRCPPLDPCGIHCPFGQATDANGCGQCACKPNPMELRRIE